MRPLTLVGVAATLMILVGAENWTLVAQEPTTVTADQVDRWMQELSNWGRWGPDDQLGAVNLITRTKRREALALAVTGDVVSLLRPISLSEPPDDPASTSAFVNLRVCTAPGFLDSGLTVFASTPPRPARGGRVAPGPGFGSRTSPASTARCTSA